MKKSSGIPMFRTANALQSLRHAGYDLPTALGEVIDNSLEASANRIIVRLDEQADKRGRKHIHRIIVVDDGTGMDETVLQNYLQIGFSTRYMRTDTIGKFGVGAKLAALNFSQRVEAYSRTSSRSPWLYVYFDMDKAIADEKKGEEVRIEAPERAEIPEYLAELMPKTSGTAIVWSRIEKLEEGRHASDVAALRLEVEKELARIFRYFLHGGRKLIVNGRELLPHDPLYLMDQTYADKVLGELPEHATDKKKGHRHFGPSLVILDREKLEFGTGNAYVTMTVYPKEVVRKKGKGGDALATKLHVPDNLGSISFVRMNREVSYTNVPRIMPKGVHDPDRFIGIEVSFSPELDEFFGIRNVKRGVEPDGELRLQVRELLGKFIPTARKKIEEIWGEQTPQDVENKGPLTQIEEAVKDADRTLPQSRVNPLDEKERKRRLDELAQDVVGDDEEKKRKYLERIKDLPYVIQNMSFPGTNFIDLQHLGDKTIVRINTRHRFYRELWEPAMDLMSRSPSEITGEETVRAARRNVEALTLLLIAYAKAEAMNGTPDEQYGDLRNFWGQFLDSLLFKVKDVI